MKKEQEGYFLKASKPTRCAPLEPVPVFLKGVSEVVEVSLSEIDMKNDPYQFRFKANPGDLIANLRLLGRQAPVILSGKAAPP